MRKGSINSSETEPLLGSENTQEEGEDKQQQQQPTIEDGIVPPLDLPPLPKRTHSDFTFFNNVTFFEFYLLALGALGALVQGFIPLGFYFYFGKLVPTTFFLILCIRIFFSCMLILCRWIMPALQTCQITSVKQVR